MVLDCERVKDEFDPSSAGAGLSPTDDRWTPPLGTGSAILVREREMSRVFDVCQL